jgi:hypothetical protein
VVMSVAAPLVGLAGILITAWSLQSSATSGVSRLFYCPLRLVFVWCVVRAVGKLVGQYSKGRWFEPGLDSDHILSPITINGFAGVRIM